MVTSYVCKPGFLSVVVHIYRVLFKETEQEVFNRYKNHVGSKTVYFWFTSIKIIFKCLSNKYYHSKALANNFHSPHHRPHSRISFCTVNDELIMRV